MLLLLPDAGEPNVLPGARTPFQNKVGKQCLQTLGLRGKIGARGGRFLYHGGVLLRSLVDGGDRAGDRLQAGGLLTRRVGDRDDMATEFLHVFDNAFQCCAGFANKLPLT